MTRQETKAQARKRAFAVAYATPDTPSFNNATEAWLVAVDPDATRESARRAGSRYLTDPYVKQIISETRAAAGIKAGMTVDKFVEECLAHEKDMLVMAKAGVKGAAQAAARYRELAGKSLGYFVQVTKDLTPRPALPMPTNRQELQQLRNGLDLMLELGEALPLPKPREDDVPEAEYEIVEVPDAAE